MGLLTVFAHGKKRAGKDTFCKIMKEECEKRGIFAQVFSFAAELRKHLEILNPIIGIKERFGWYTEKTYYEPLTWNDAIILHGYDQAKEKYPEMRRIQQIYGTEVIRERVNKNYWVNVVTSQADDATRNHPNAVILLADTRFPNEPLGMRSYMLRASGNMEAVKVVRPEKEEGDVHASENQNLDAAFTAIGVPQHELLNETTREKYKDLCRKVAQELLDKHFAVDSF